MTQVFDWASAPNPVWRKLGPEIAEALREVAALPCSELRPLPKLPLPVPRHKQLPSIADIQHAVCAEFGVRHVHMVGEVRETRIVHPRWIAIYLARELTGKSLEVISRAFNRDHSTVSAAISRVRSNPDLLQLAERLKASLNA